MGPAAAITNPALRVLIGLPAAFTRGAFTARLNYEHASLPPACRALLLTERAFETAAALT